MTKWELCDTSESSSIAANHTFLTCFYPFKHQAERLELPLVFLVCCHERWGKAFLMVIYSAVVQITLEIAHGIDHPCCLLNTRKLGALLCDIRVQAWSWKLFIGGKRIAHLCQCYIEITFLRPNSVT